MNFLTKLPNNIAILLILIYRSTFSPSVGFFRFLPFYPKPSCIFYPTCSEYGIAVYKKLNFLKATKKIIKRLSKCHPGNEPSIDLP